jgi:hypothetical protein
MLNLEQTLALSAPSSSPSQHGQISIQQELAAVGLAVTMLASVWITISLDLAGVLHQ